MKPWLFTATILCAFLLASCSGVKDAIKKHYYDQGLHLVQEGKHHEAALAFRKAIQKDSEFGEAYYQLGLAELHAGGNLLRAAAAFRRASVLLPYREEPKARLAQIYIGAYLGSGGLEKYPIEEAKKLAKLMLVRNAKSYEALRLSGHIAALEDREKEAIDWFRKADAVKPGRTEVLLPLAEALYQDHQAEASEELLRRLVEHDGACVICYEVLYQHYMQEKRLADGEALLKNRLSQHPEDSGALLRLAAHYYRGQKLADMEAALARLKTDPKLFPIGRLQVGDFYRSIGRLREARAEYQAGLGLNNADKTEYEKRLAGVLLLEGKRDEAFDAYASVIKRQPKDQESRETRAALLLEKDVDASLKEFQAIVQDTPNNPMARYNLGQAYLAKRDFAQARVSFLEASRRQRTFLLPRIALAHMSLEANQFKDVEDYADDILRISPNNPEGKFFRCAAMVGLGRYSEARRELNKLVQEYPKYPEVRLELAFVDLAERRYADAEATLSRLYRDTSDVRALHGMVDVLMAQRQDQRALDLVAGELKKNPGGQRIRLLLAQTALKQQKWGLALEHLGVLVSVDPNWDFLYLRIGEAYQASGDLSRAVNAYRKARQLSPKSLEAVLRLAYAFEVAREYKDAMATYREVLVLNPAVPIALNNLAFLLAEHGGDLNEAMRLAQSAQRYLPQQSHVSDTIGWITLRKRQPDAAAQIFSTLVRKYPEDPAFRYHLAYALLEKGDRGRAKTEAQLALARKPSAEQERQIRELIGRLQ